VKTEIYICRRVWNECRVYYVWQHSSMMMYNTLKLSNRILDGHMLLISSKVDDHQCYLLPTQCQNRLCHQEVTQLMRRRKLRKQRKFNENSQKWTLVGKKRIECCRKAQNKG